MLIVLPVQTFQPGSHTLGPFVIQSGLSAVKVSLSRAEWLDPTVQVNARFELSLDGGVTWSPNPSGELVFPWAPFPIVFTARGGNILRPGGGFSTESSLRATLPQPGSLVRNVRGQVQISGGALRTSVSMETT